MEKVYIMFHKMMQTDKAYVTYCKKKITTHPHKMAISHVYYLISKNTRKETKQIISSTSTTLYEQES